MKVNVIMFSPAGGTARTAEMLAKELGTLTGAVDIAEHDIFYEGIRADAESIAIVAMPCYGGRVPQLAAERFKKVDGNGAKTVLLCVYGNRAYEDTLVEMEDLAKERNFNVIGAVAAIAQHSIVNKFGAGRPDSSDAAKLKEFAKKILAKIESGDTSKPHVPGNRPYKKAMGKLGLVPHATKGCLYCGVCAKKCPVQAIDIDKIFGASRRKCISCMRCVANCSTDVRRLNGLELKLVETKIKKEASSRKEPELFL